MKFAIENCVAWCGNLRTTEDWQLWSNDKLTYQLEDDLPQLKQIPAMQKRRLSRFAKLSFHCVLESLGENITNIPCVFSSRHGDLHKTAKLIEDVANKNDLSPTNFGLSVHNAVAGLYSIFSNNKHPMTAISAGEDSFLIALVDAYAKLEANKLDRILVVYTDEVVPEKYKQYVSAKEQTISIALILTKQSELSEVEVIFKKQQNEMSESESFQPLAFLKFLYGSDKSVKIDSKRYQWNVSK